MNISTELGFFNGTQPVHLERPFKRNTIAYKLARHINEFSFDTPTKMPLVRDGKGKPLTPTSIRQALNRISRAHDLGGYTAGIGAEPTLNHPDYPDHETQYFMVTLYRPDTSLQQPQQDQQPPAPALQNT